MRHGHSRCSSISMQARATTNVIAGQILRNATALAAISGRSVLVNQIRLGRPKPGLRPQHLAGLQLVARICGGALVADVGRAAAVGCTRVELRPLDGAGRMAPAVGSYEADAQTAGSCTLMVQQALPCLLFARPMARR